MPEKNRRELASHRPSANSRERCATDRGGDGRECARKQQIKQSPSTKIQLTCEPVDRSSADVGN